MEKTHKSFRYWRIRVVVSLIFGYACYYMMRNNFTLLRASEKCPFSAETIGWAFSAYSVIYGISKFIAGVACDRTSARRFMVIGLTIAALCNCFAGFSAAAWLYGLLYAVSAFPQSMGFPAIGKILTRWFSIQKLGTVWGCVGTAGPIGSTLTYVIGGRLLEYCDWQWLFFIPGIFCLLFACFLGKCLRDTPEAAGLPVPERKDGTFLPEAAREEPASKSSVWNTLNRHVFRNTRLWMASFANFFIYLIYSGLRCWGPVMFVETLGCSVAKAGLIMGIIEVGNLLGAVVLGRFTDRYMPNKRGLCLAILMLCVACTAASLGLCHTAGSSDVHGTVRILPILLWIGIGFCISGPQSLCTLLAAEFGSEKATAAAVGFTGLTGYAGAFVSGIGIATLSKNFGWQSIPMFFAVAAFLGSVFFLLTLGKSRSKQSV